MSAEQELEQWSEPEVAEVVAQLRSSRKYRDLADPALRRVARWALRGRRGHQAVKAAKRKLHQVYGAYMDPGALEAAERAAEALAGGGLTVAQRRSTCLDVLRRHASTAERIPFLEEFYADLTAGLPPVRSVLDLACGLNPFALPWLDLPEGTEYLAVDVNTRLARLFDSLSGAWPVSLAGLAHDLVDGPPPVAADVALLLKAVPCLEQQEAGAGRRLLAALQAPVVVLSFPARSLGGRDKGMRRTYERLLADLAGQEWEIEVRTYPTETVYRLTRR